MPVHPFAPVYDRHSSILILGSFPSVRSREEGFYYGHPRNRFWPMLALHYGEPLPGTVQEKAELLLTHRLALWDVLAGCEISGSSDAAIRHASVNDLSVLMAQCPIDKVLCNGKTAGKYYAVYMEPVFGMKAEVLPSTSPANAAFSMERLLAAWGPYLP